MFEIDANFHEMLARYSGNEPVLEVVRRQKRLRLLMEYESYPDAARASACLAEHVAVIDALLDNNQASASERIAQHLYNAMSQSIGTTNGSGEVRTAPRSPAEGRQQAPIGTQRRPQRRARLPW